MTFATLIADADRAVQNNLGASSITYQPSVGPAVVVKGMFDPVFVLVDDGNMGQEQTTPSVFVLLADLPVDPIDDDPTITVEGVNYRVRERRVDPVGQAVRLLLHLADA